MRKLLLLTLLASTPALAQEAPPAHSFAFVVGANRGGAQQQELRYAEEDARRLAELLTSLGRFPASNVHLLSAPTRAQFLATTNWVRGRFDDGLNLTQQIDFQYLPGHRWDGAYDPEGILSTLPAIGTCLLGVFAGLLLRNNSVPDQKKVIYLLLSGVGAVLIGFLWGLQFPVIKKIWTSSYVLVAGGFSAMLLGVFHQIVDVWGHRRWATPFIWIGANAITLYFVENIVNYERLAGRLAGGDVSRFFDAHVAAGAGQFIAACLGLLLAIALAGFLYRRKIFLRV